MLQNKHTGKIYKETIVTEERHLGPPMSALIPGELGEVYHVRKLNFCAIDGFKQ